MNDVLMIVFSNIRIGDFKKLSQVNKNIRNSLIAYFNKYNSYDYDIYSLDEVITNSTPFMVHIYKYYNVNELFVEAIKRNIPKLVELLCRSEKIKTTTFITIGGNIYFETVCAICDSDYKMTRIISQYNTFCVNLEKVTIQNPFFWTLSQNDIRHYVAINYPEIKKMLDPMLDGHNIDIDTIFSNNFASINIVPLCIMPKLILYYIGDAQTEKLCKSVLRKTFEHIQNASCIQCADCIKHIAHPTPELYLWVCGQCRQIVQYIKDPTVEMRLAAVKRYIVSRNFVTLWRYFSMIFYVTKMARHIFIQPCVTLNDFFLEFILHFMVFSGCVYVGGIVGYIWQDEMRMLKHKIINCAKKILENFF